MLVSFDQLLTLPAINPVALSTAPTLPKEPKEQREKVLFAMADDPTVQAIINERFRFKTEAQGTLRLLKLQERFTGGEMLVDAETPSILLWIKGYAITSMQEQQGYLGNFARLFVKKLTDDTFTLSHETVVKKLTQHPRRRKISHKHPNWSHPVLRTVQKNFVYPDLTAAQDALRLLHEEFPDISIPSDENTLHMMVYNRASLANKEDPNPIQKVILRVKEKEDGVRISFKEKQRKPLGGAMTVVATNSGR